MSRSGNAATPWSIVARMALKLHRCSTRWRVGPCWRVQKALEEQGIDYEVVKGPARPGKRTELQRISGQKLYPVIEFENGAIYREESKDMAATIRACQLDKKRGASTRLRACLAERRSEEGATTAAAGTPASATSHRSSTKANTTTDTRSPTPNLSTEVGELHVGGWSIVATRRRCRRGRCRCTSPTRGRCSGSRGRSRQAWPGSSSRTAGPRNRLTVAGRTGPPPIQWLLYSTASLIAAGRVSGHGCLLSCLALVRRAAGVSVRMVRSLAVCWSMACGPLPVSSRTDGS